jgi:hypothetical protein
MAETLTLTRATQIAVETTHGTVVSANKQLKMLGLTMGPNLDFKIFKGMARRANSTVVLNKNMTVGKLGGKLNYTEIVYPLSGIWGAATITTPGGGTLSRKWAWIPPVSGVIDPKSFSFENGDSVRAQKFGYGFCPEISMSLAREGDCEFESVVWGQAMTDGITMTSSPSVFDQIPVVGKHLSWYVDTTSAGLGTTKLLRAWTGKFGYSDAYNVLWPMDRAQTSFAVHADNDSPKPEFTLTVEADTQGMGLYAAAIAGTPQYVRMESFGDIIESTIPWSLVIDMATKITKIGELKDGTGNTIALDVTFTAIEDPSWGSGQFLSAYVINKQTAL